MYLHIGGEKEVFAGKIICILNYDPAQNIGSVINLSDYELTDLSAGKGGSLVLTQEFTGRLIAYISPISSGTLKKRLESATQAD